MLSFKVCLASVAVALFTLAPSSVAASPSAIDALSPLSRRMSMEGSILIERSVVAASEPAMAKREARKAAAARARLAKTRAARKAKRDAVVSDKSFVKRTTAFNAGKTTTAFASYLATKCFRNSACAYAEVKAALPAGGAAVCNASTRTCAIDCASGYILQNDGSCKEGSTTCPTLKHGAYFVQDGACVPACSSSQGYTLTGTSQANYKCVNYSTNASHCGTASASVSCATSYNGIGSARCLSGRCALNCPAGYFQYSTSTGALYCS